MKVHFKTSYDHDIRLFADSRRALGYLALLALAIALPETKSETETAA